MKKTPKVFDTESFIRECILKFGNDRFDYSKVDYISAKTEVKIRCLKHDLWFEAQPYTHRVGKGSCPACMSEVLGQYHKLSVEDFVRKAKQVHNNYYSYENTTHFKNMHEYVVITCPTHGDFLQSPTNHIHNGFGCAECACVRRGLESRLSQEDIILRFKERHGDKYCYSQVEYDGIYTPVRIFCKEHNNWFLQKPNDHFSGTGCRLCIDKGYSRNKSGYIYINKVGDNVAIKVGITNVCPIQRAKVLNRKSDSYNIEPLYYFYHEDGGFINDLETEILSTFPTGLVSKVDMKSGYTETLSCQHLPEVIDIIVYKFNTYKPD